MARSLKGRVFYECHNNGVFALVAREVFESRERFEKIRKALAAITPMRDGREFDVALLSAIGLARRPIFTFVDSKRYESSPWFTGDTALHNATCEYILAEGGLIVAEFFFVPFSNGAELGHHGLDAQCAELWFVTTDEEYASTFGVTPEVALQNYRDRKPAD